MAYRDVDGKELYGVLRYPIGYVKGQKYPTVFEIYETFFDNGFNARAAFLANHGYAVFHPSVNLVVGRPGEAWVKGVTSAANKLIDMGIADPDRLGVHGTSYGGYATCLLITQTDRFKAAINISGKVDMVSFYTDSPRLGVRNTHAPEKSQDRIGGTLWEYPERYLEHSAMLHADRIKTPLLNITGDQDPNVPASQSREMYYALRRLGKEVEWVRYINGGHRPPNSRRGGVDFEQPHPRLVRQVFEKEGRKNDDHSLIVGPTFMSGVFGSPGYWGCSGTPDLKVGPTLSQSPYPDRIARSHHRECRAPRNRCISAERIEQRPDRQRAEKSGRKPERRMDRHRRAARAGRRRGNRGGRQRRRIGGDSGAVEAGQENDNQKGQRRRPADGRGNRSRRRHRPDDVAPGADAGRDLLSADAGGNADERDERRGGGRAPAGSARLARQAVGEERHEPRAHREELPHVRAVADDVVHRLNGFERRGRRFEGFEEVRVGSRGFEQVRKGSMGFAEHSARR